MQMCWNKRKVSVIIKEKSLIITPTGFVWYINMAAILEHQYECYDVTGKRSAETTKFKDEGLGTNNK